MMSSRTIRADSPGRAAPRGRTTRFALVALALATFGFEGCASFGGGKGDDCGLGSVGKCGGCGTCGFKKFGGLFHRKSSPYVAGDITPMETVPMGTTPGMITPGSGNPMTPDDNPDLSPIQGTGSSKKTTGNSMGSNSSPSKAVYQADITRSSGGSGGARRDLGSGRSALPSLAGGISAPGPDDPLAGLPDGHSPQETTGEASPPRSPTAASPAADPSPKLVPTPSSTAAELPPKPADGAAASSMAPGFRRFKVLEPNLAAGSLPIDDSGWAWLVEKGYKTVLDLREPGEIRQEEMAAIDHYGLRYVSLACSPRTIDPARVKRFAAETSQEAARPIFVFDGDGSRPAALYFVQQVGVARKEAKAVEKDLEDLGASESPLWRAAGDYVAKLPAAASAPAPTGVTATPISAPVTAELVAVTPEVVAAAKTQDEAPLTMPTPEPAASLPPPSAPISDRASGSWKPYMTLALATLGLPLAYLSRSAIHWGGRALASLPAPGRGSKSLPSESGGGM